MNPPSPYLRFDKSSEALKGSTKVCGEEWNLSDACQQMWRSSLQSIHSSSNSINRLIYTNSCRSLNPAVSKTLQKAPKSKTESTIQVWSKVSHLNTTESTKTHSWEINSVWAYSFSTFLSYLMTLKPQQKSSKYAEASKPSSSRSKHNLSSKILPRVICFIYYNTRNEY